MADSTLLPLGPGLSVGVSFSDAEDGDFRVIDAAPGIEERRRAIVDAPWSWVRQVHGTTVLEVNEPGQHAGAEADGLLTTSLGTAIAVTTADCAPVVLLAERGVAVVHAGWRGLLGGIIEEAASRLSTLAGAPIGSLLGPCIAPAAYEFGRHDLDQVVARFGPAVESVTESGSPALDVPAAVALACVRAGWPGPERPACTSDPRWYSHRTRADRGRQTAVAWLIEDKD
ncbi:MAG: polyphenol oxidase family protein [Acidimicrobiales bacterium]